MKNKLTSSGLKLLVLILINLLLIENDIQIHISNYLFYGMFVFSFLMHLWSFDKVGYVLYPLFFMMVHYVLQLNVSEKLLVLVNEIFWKEGEGARTVVENRIMNLKLEAKSKGLVYNLLLADKSLLDKGLKEQVSQIGGAHLLAVSGMHLGIIFFIASSILKRVLWFKKELVLLSLMMVLIFYAYITGFSVPVIRALIMVLIIVLGELFGKKHDSLNTLFLTASIILLVDPNQIQSWSFQFSFMGVLGIILGLRYIYQFKSENIFLKALVNLMLVSLYAQLFLFPLLLYHVGEVPTYFLITSMVLTPVIYLLIFISIVLCIFDLDLLIFLTEMLTSFIEKFSYLISRFPMAMLEVNDLGLVQLSLLYSVIFTVKSLLLTKKYWILNVILLEVYVLLKISLSC